MFVSFHHGLRVTLLMSSSVKLFIFNGTPRPSCHAGQLPLTAVKAMFLFLIINLMSNVGYAVQTLWTSLFTSIIHSANTYYVPGILLDSGDKSISQTDKNPNLH